MTDTNGQGVVAEAPAAPEMVELHEASDADLDAFLASQEQEEEGTPAAPPTPSTEVKEVAQSSSPAASEETPSKVDESEQDVGQRLEKLQRQLDGLELITKRRTSELADVKQRLNSYLQTANAQIEEKMALNPVEGTKDLLKIREAEQHLSQVEKAEQELAMVRQNQEAVLRNIDLEETPIDTIAQVFLSDGIAPEVVQQFRQNPWMVPATTTIQAAKRAKAENYLRLLVPEFKKLQAEVKQLKNGGQDALKKIQNVAKEIPGITAASGGVGATAGDSSNVPVHMMTDAQLEALLRRS